VHVYPQGEEIFMWAKFIGEVHPQAESASPLARQSKSPFFLNWGDVDGGRGYLGV